MNLSCSSPASSSSSCSKSDVEVGAEDSCPMAYSISSSALSPDASMELAFGEQCQSSTTLSVEAHQEVIHRKPKLSFSIEALIGIK